uniref:Uncharacterized protein n=1 Tax=Rhizophora mucronata TaxID=61149 RepID=A0A2P2P191_RHIMU
MEKVAKEEVNDDYRPEHDVGESSSSILAYRKQRFQPHQDLNVSGSSRPNNGFFE